jgi:hypothetical protein
MKRVVLVIVASLITSNALLAQYGGRLNTSIPAGDSIMVVSMKRKMPAPYFYYRSFDFNYVILVPAESVSSALDRSAQS